MHAEEIAGKFIKRVFYKTFLNIHFGEIRLIYRIKGHAVYFVRTGSCAELLDT